VKISNRNIAIAGFVLALITAFYYFQLTGVRTVAAIAVFFFLPFYLILRKLNIDGDEKVFFAFFLGLGLFSTIVFYVGRVIPSYRAAVAVAFVALMLVPFILKIILRRKNTQ